MRELLVGLLIMVTTTACSGAFGKSIFGMNDKEIKEWVKDKDASCSKFTGVYMGATITGVNINVDKGIPPGNFGGTVEIDDNCKTKITIDPKVKQ